MCSDGVNSTSEDYNIQQEVLSWAACDMISPVLSTPVIQEMAGRDTTLIQQATHFTIFSLL